MYFVAKLLNKSDCKKVKLCILWLNRPNACLSMWKMCLSWKNIFLIMTFSIPTDIYNKKDISKVGF